MNSISCVCSFSLFWFSCLRLTVFLSNFLFNWTQVYFWCTSLKIHGRTWERNVWKFGSSCKSSTFLPLSCFLSSNPFHCWNMKSLTLRITMFIRQTLARFRSLKNEVLSLRGAFFLGDTCISVITVIIGSPRLL
jgi:hypothetical protein